jgi:amino acid adenylation domain-containing protein
MKTMMEQGDNLKKSYIHHLFEQQVQHTPEAIAVGFQNRQLTYQELNTKANQLAHYLRSQGVTTETLVGICIDRSLDMLVGLLGILKAGGVYIPLDPAYPAERLAFMLADSQAHVIVTQESLVVKLEQLAGEERRVLVCVDDESEQITSQRQENLDLAIAGDNLAYIIYTSGSTGKPKGVQISHQSLSNFLTSMQTILAVRESEVFLAVTTISFDIAALELYLPLITGARSIVVSRETALDGHKLLAEIRRSGVTVMQSTPAMWQMLLGCAPQNLCLKKILCGGEALTHRLSQQLLTIGREVWNLYGPTETTIWSSAYRVIGQTADQTSLEPIGTAIANTELYILDEDLQLVPTGSFGELHIGGMGLARGYLNRPELTAQKFIPHPFNKLPQARLYKTGDRVRCLPDGNLEFADRLDLQVKIRGFRIELGEIEAALSNHPQVRAAVVIAREDEPGTKRLVAYIVTTEEKSPTASEWRGHLLQTLPDYMIPAAFVQLSSLPLTPNCKVDRRALPAPPTRTLELEADFAAPQDELELKLTEIWEQVLKIHPIGITNNFFDLGGNSLLAMIIFTQINTVCQTHLPLSVIFQAPTIEELAKAIRDRTALPNYYSLVPIQPKGDLPPLFMIHSLGFRDLYRHLGTDRPIYGLHYGLADPGDLVPDLPTIEDLATHYIKEMCDFQPHGPYFLMGHCGGGTIAYEMSRQLLAQGREVALLALLNTNLEEGNNRKAISFTQKLANIQQRGLPQLLAIALHRLQDKFNALKSRFSRSDIIDKNSFIKKINNPRLATAMSNYIPQPYSGRVVLFKAMNPVVSVHYSVEEPEVVLSKFVDGAIELHGVPGDNGSMLQEPNIAIVAETIRKYLELDPRTQIPHSALFE